MPMSPEERLKFDQTITLINSNDPSITHLNLSRMRLSCQEVIVLCNALAGNTVVTSLDLSINNIGNAGAQALTNIRLLSLDLGFNTKIDATGMQALAGSASLRSLFLNGTALVASGNDINLAGFQALANNATLTCLDLRLREVGDAGAQILAGNVTLKKLNVAGNRISDIGIQAFANHPSLESLIAADNLISDIGAQVFTGNTMLTYLNLAINRMISAASEALIKQAIIRNKQSIIEAHVFSSMVNPLVLSPFSIDIIYEVCTFLVNKGRMKPLMEFAAQRALRGQGLFQPAIAENEHASAPENLGAPSL